jgi:hypothetical protein
MHEFSLDTGTPIAVIIDADASKKSSKPKSKYLMIKSPDKELYKYSSNQYDLVSDVDFEKYEEKTKKRLQLPLVEPQPVYNKRQVKTSGQRTGVNFMLNSGKLRPIPQHLSARETRERDVFYVVGESGSGKSYFTVEYAKSYHKYYPDNMIYLLSECKVDSAFDDSSLPFQRIPLDDDFKSATEEGAGLVMTDFENSLVIFDDVDTIMDNKVKTYVSSLRDQILETGRKHYVSIVMTSHVMSAGLSTKRQLSESSFVVFFPGTSFDYQIHYYLEKKAYIEKKVVDKIMSLNITRNARWVMVSIKAPRYVMYETGAFLI